MSLTTDRSSQNLDANQRIDITLCYIIKGRSLMEQPSLHIPPVAADKSLITQAVTRFLENAIKYSPERTAVTVSTVLEAEAVRVTVEDRGYGVPAESIDRIWEKFYRVARDGQ